MSTRNFQPGLGLFPLEGHSYQCSEFCLYPWHYFIEFPSTMNGKKLKILNFKWNKNYPPLSLNRTAWHKNIKVEPWFCKVLCGMLQINIFIWFSFHICCFIPLWIFLGGFKPLLNFIVKENNRKIGNPPMVSFTKYKHVLYG